MKLPNGEADFLSPARIFLYFPKVFQRDVKGFTQNAIMDKRAINLSLLLMITVAILLPRIFSLDSYVTTDENLWAFRSANFYYGLGQRDFYNKTSHPGVTTMWAGTAGFLWRFPEYRGLGVGFVNSTKYKNILEEHGFKRPDLLAAGRVFMVLANTVALGVSFLYAKRLLGRLPAILGVLFIAFDPFHIAHSRLLHLDGLLSSLLLLSFLAFLYFLDQNHLRDLIVSGIAAGFCWLTKSTGVIMAPIVFLLVLIEIYRKSKCDSKSFESHKSFLAQNIWRYFRWMVVWGVIGGIVFTLFWPSMWVDPIGTISRVFLEAYGQSSGGWGGPIYFNKEIIPDGNLSLLFYPLSYLWRSSPIVLLGLIFTIVATVKGQNFFRQVKIKRTLSGLLVFVCVFLLAISLGQKKVDRYLLPIFAPLDLIAALGWFAAVNWLTNTKIAKLVKAPQFIYAIAILLQMILALRTYPYYLSYYNPILGGADRAAEIMMIGWGEGLDQAALYLNMKPDANKLHCISWYGDGSFSYFFLGNTYTFSTTKELGDAELDEILDLDYAVIYIQQRQRGVPNRLLSILDQEIPEYTFWHNHIEYVRIYNLKTIREHE